MKAEIVLIESLSFDPANVRKHPERNLATIKASLLRFGQQKPIVVDASGVVRAGNGTLAAAKALGWKEIAIVRSSLKGSDATAYAIADNRTAELAEWDNDALAQTLAALQIEDEALLEAAGFDASELQAMTDPGEVVEDEVPEPPVDPITKPGDLWLLGEHRVLCGDSTKAEDVARLMDGDKADAIISDPPYGMNYTGCAGDAQDGMKTSQRKKVVPIIGDDKPFDPWPIVSVFGDPLHVMLWGADWFYDKLPAGGSIVVWDKRASAAADSTPGAPFEILWSNKRRAREFIRHPWGGWINKESGETERHHPTQKPLRCMAYPIDVSTEKGELIVDPFLGSGTTLIAAEQLGRKCYGMEISPAYCDVIVKRWETLTGKKATRA
jgi:ParB-like chromosome segregation protein Spo0J